MPRNRSSRARRARTMYIHVSVNTVEDIVEIHAATSASDNEVLVRSAYPNLNEIITTTSVNLVSAIKTSPAPATIPMDVAEEFDGIYLECDELEYES